jgi:hypothetical protein
LRRPWRVWPLWVLSISPQSNLRCEHLPSSSESSSVGLAGAFGLVAFFAGGFSSSDPEALFLPVNLDPIYHSHSLQRRPLLGRVLDLRLWLWLRFGLGRFNSKVFVLLRVFARCLLLALRSRLDRGLRLGLATLGSSDVLLKQKLSSAMLQPQLTSHSAWKLSRSRFQISCGESLSSSTSSASLTSRSCSSFST